LDTVLWIETDSANVTAPKKHSDFLKICKFIPVVPLPPGWDKTIQHLFRMEYLYSHVLELLPKDEPIRSNTMFALNSLRFSVVNSVLVSVQCISADVLI
jgi:hypothetical protein